MLGLELENDEWVAAIAVTCLVLRVLCGIARVVWGYVIDIPPSLPYSGGIGIGIFLVFLTPVAVAAMAIALVSIASGGLRQDIRIMAYSAVGVAGFCWGIVLEVRIISSRYKFSLWLASFKVPRYREQLQSGNPVRPH